VTRPVSTTGRWSRPVALLAAGVILAVPTVVGVGPLGWARSASSDGDPDAMALLERASTASDATAYQGTQFVTSWGTHGTTTLLVDVGHLPGRGTAVEVRSTGEQPGTRYWTRSQKRATDLVQVGQVGDGALALLSRNYRVSEGGRAAVAGRPAQIVEAHREDSIAARFWLDEQTGLVLRREVYDVNGRTTSASAFIEISMTAPRMSQVPPTLPESPKDEVTWDQLDEIEDDGWECPRSLPGGSMTLYEARRVTGDDGEVLHLSYSDGLSVVSVFQQWGSLDPKGLHGYSKVATPDGPVWVREGAPTRVVWSADGTVYTVLANAPDDVVDDVVAAWPHEAPDNGFWARLGRGLARVASWFNPFG
jgi:sigma-E factor negative regulatory protein RseB